MRLSCFVANVGDPLSAVVGPAVAADDSVSAELGGTKAADGGAKLTDAVADSLKLAVAVAVPGARRAGLCAVGASDARSELDGTATRGAGGSALVAGGVTTVDGATVGTVDGATTAAVLVCTGCGRSDAAISPNTGPVPAVAAALLDAGAVPSAAPNIQQLHRWFGGSVTAAASTMRKRRQTCSRAGRAVLPITGGRVAVGLFAAAASMAVAPTAAAEPVWPVAGAASAAATISDLEDQGYNVQINWVSGQISVSLTQCKVLAIHNPDNSPGSETTFTTVYIDVSCPNRDDDYWGGVGVGVGF